MMAGIRPYQKGFSISRLQRSRLQKKIRHILGLLLLCVVSQTVSGCAIRHRVRTKALLEVPLEYKLSLFDAENGLLVVVDQRERAARRIDDVEQEYERMDGLIDAAKQGAKQARQQKDKPSYTLAKMAVKTYQLKRSYLKRRIAVLEEEVDGFKKLKHYARAKYELEKARVLKQYRPQAARRIRLKRFEKQVHRWKKKAAVIGRSLKKKRVAARKSRQRWSKARLALNRASRGRVGSPWLEEVVAWGVDPWDSDE